MVAVVYDVDAHKYNAAECEAKLKAAVASERERCARIADERTAEDIALYQNETDWRMPYALNRVVRASMDIASAIRNPGSVSV